MNSPQKTASDKTASWLFLAPAIIFLILGSVLPLLSGFYLSFHKFRMNIPKAIPEWIGFQNYKEAFASEILLNAFFNNLIFATVTVVTEITLGVMLALFLTERRKQKYYIMTVVLIPMVISPVAAGILWRIMLDRSYGIINQLLSFVNIKEVSWLSDPNIGSVRKLVD